jgi:hypothetical protein
MRARSPAASAWATPPTVKSLGDAVSRPAQEAGPALTRAHPATRVAAQHFQPVVHPGRT